MLENLGAGVNDRAHGPQPLGRVVVVLEDLVAGVNSIDLGALGPQGLRELFTGIGNLRSAIDALEVRATAAMTASGTRRSGTAQVLRETTGCSQRQARRQANRAETLSRMPKITSALADGAITPEHADAFVKAAKQTSAQTVDDDSDLLAEAAKLPADLAAARTAEWTRRHQSPDDIQIQFLRQRRLRSQWFYNDDDGMTVAKACFDTVLGAQYRAIIDSIANRLYEADGGRDAPAGTARTLDQRRLDALAIAVGLEPHPPPPPKTPDNSGHQEINAGNKHREAGHGTARRQDPQPAHPQDHQPAHPQVHQPAHPQDQATASVIQNGGIRCGPQVSMRNQIIVTVDSAVITGADPQGRCEITGSGPIPRSELERLACDADIYGIVLSGEGLPLWHGRRTRSVSPQQWRTLIARDKGCVLCAVAPAFCNAHHIVPWSHGGPTDIGNLALVCASHHRQIHDRDLILTRQPDAT